MERDILLSMRIMLLILLAPISILLAQGDPSTIPMRVGQGVTPINSPLDNFIRAQQARRLQLENQALQQQIQQQQVQQQNQANSAQPTQSAVPAPRQAGPEGMTLGFVNGRSWNNATIDMKFSYIVGIAEAIALSGGDVTRFLARTLSAAEDAKGVDRFYEDPGNLPVPVSFAMQIVAMRANGEKPEAIEGFTQGVKRAIIDAQAVPKP